MTASNCRAWLALATKARVNECVPLIDAILGGIGRLSLDHLSFPT